MSPPEDSPLAAQIAASDPRLVWACTYAACAVVLP